MRFYLSNTRVGTVLHSWLYLFGLPALFEDSYNNLELDDKASAALVIQDYGLSTSTGSVHINNSTNSSTVTSEPPLVEKCYDGWGCFTLKYPSLRGFNLFPESLEEINPSLCFYTGFVRVDRNNNQGQGHRQGQGQRHGCEWCQIVEEETIRSLNPHPQAQNDSLTSGRSYWILHGYMENGQRPWIKEMVCALLEEDPGSNVFVLDWAEGAKPPYSQAIVNLDLLAVYAGRMMKTLRTLYTLELERVHIIGHSLGGHLAGLIGDWVKVILNSSLGRISGLDPAQPHFQGLPPDAGLDSEDATFVDVLHTDARPMMDGGNVGVGLGIQTALGHADFYPNDGKEQPGCKDGVYSAILLEDESIPSSISSCQFTGYSCPSWKSFVTGECPFGEKNRMGFHATKPPVPRSFYLLTGPKAPFCRDHFIVTIYLASESSYRSTSDLHLVLLDQNKKEITTLVIDWTELRGGNLSYTYLREGHSSTSSISRLILRPAMSNPLLWFVNRLAPKKPDLSLRSITIRHLEEQQDNPIRVQNGDDEDSNLSRFCPEGSPSFSISDQNPNVVLLKSGRSGC